MNITNITYPVHWQVGDNEKGELTCNEIYDQYKALFGDPSTYSKDTLWGQYNLLKDEFDNLDGDYNGIFEEQDGSLTQKAKENYVGYEVYKFYYNKLTKALANIREALDAAQDAFEFIEAENVKFDTNQISEGDFLSKFREKITELQICEDRTKDYVGDIVNVTEFKKRTEESTKKEYITTSIFPDSSRVADYNFYKDGTTTKDGKTLTALEYLRTKEEIQDLNLFEKLKYMGLYYEIVQEKGIDTHVYIDGDNTDEYEKGLPCIAIKQEFDAKGNAIANPKFSLQLEEFYTCYVVDKEGAVNGFSVLLASKAEAAKAQLGEYLKDINIYNQILDCAHLAIDELSELQNDGVAEERASDNVMAFVNFIMGSKLQRYNYKGKDYLLLQRSYEATEDTFIMIPLDDDKSLKKFMYPKTFSDDNTLDGNLKYFGNLIIGLNNRYLNKNYGAFDPLTGETTTIEGELQDQDCILISNPGDEFGYTNLSEFSLLKAGKNVQKNFKSINSAPFARGFSSFPKAEELEEDPTTNEPISDADEMIGVARGNLGKEDSKSWVKLIETYTSAVNTSIQSTNNDVKSFQGKLDTFESAVSSLKKKAYNIYNSIVSTIR